MLEIVRQNYDFLFQGVLSTLELSVISIVFGTLLSVVLALIRYMKIPVISRIFALYIGLIQGAPLLVVLLVCYLAVPALLGYTTSAYNAAVLSFSLFIAPYLAEDIRAGLESVRPGLISAALASGLTWRQAVRFIVLPIALRSIIPTLVNQYVRLIKFTSVASIIGTTELTGNAMLVNARVFEPIPLLGFVAIAYLIICQAISFIGRWLYTRLAVRT